MNRREWERSQERLNKLVAVVEAAINVKLSQAAGGSFYGEYAPRDIARGAIKIRVSDHANLSTNGRHDAPDVNFVAKVGRRYTKPQVRAAIAAAIRAVKSPR